MKRALCLLAGCLALGAAKSVWAAGGAVYAPALRGDVVGFRLAGIEPDGDPLDQVVLSTTLSPGAQLPGTHLVISAYMENFTPDTTPVLPDLLHPTQNAVNLGGFLQGKAILTDDAGNALAIGSFVAEAFLDNTNHAVVQFFPSGGDRTRGLLKGIFALRADKSGKLSGSLRGSLLLSPAALGKIAAHRGASLRSIQKIIGLVTVHPAPMMGKATTGSPSAPLKTGYGSSPQTSGHNTPAGAASPARTLSPWTVVAGAGAVVSLLLAAVLFVWQRRHPEPASPPA